MATKQVLVAGELTAVDNTQAAFRSVQESARKTSKQAAQLNQQFRFLRGGAGQLGHQIQDIAVQLSMGTNALIVFGQQGSQIASLFGPKGAMLGAFAAVAAAIGVVFMRDTKQAANELETFGEKAMQAAREVGILTTASRAFLLEIQRGRVNKAAEEYHEYRRRLEESNQAVVDLQKDQAALSGGSMTAAQSIRLQGSSLESVNALLDEQTRKSTLLAGQVEILKGEHEAEALALRALLEGANPYEDLVKNAEDATASLQETIDKREKREQHAMDLRLARLSQLQSINDAEMKLLIDRDKAQQEALDKERERETQVLDLRRARTANIISNANAELDAIVATAEKKKALQQAEISMNNQVMTSGQQVIGQLLSGMDQQSGAYKALFAVQQGLAIAQTIMNTEMAAIAALAPPPVGLGPVAGIPYAGVIRAIGYASAAIIAGQTIASFEGGGMIPNGPRSGGVDGRGGRMAIVHPNEKITDMRQRDDSQPVNINFNIQANDADGFDQLLMKRRGMIVSMVNKAINNRGRRSLT